MKRSIRLAAKAQARRTTALALRAVMVCALGALGMGAIECRATQAEPQGTPATPRATEGQQTKPPAQVPGEVVLDSGAAAKRVEPRPGGICVSVCPMDVLSFSPAAAPKLVQIANAKPA